MEQRDDRDATTNPRGNLEHCPDIPPVRRSVPQLLVWPTEMPSLMELLAGCSQQDQPECRPSSEGPSSRILERISQRKRDRSTSCKDLRWPMIPLWQSWWLRTESYWQRSCISSLQPITSIEWPAGQEMRAFVINPCWLQLCVISASAASNKVNKWEPMDLNGLHNHARQLAYKKVLHMFTKLRSRSSRRATMKSLTRHWNVFSVKSLTRL